MGSYLVSRSRTCCLRLGMVVRASTMVHAACLAAWVAGVKSTYNTRTNNYVMGGWTTTIHVCSGYIRLREKGLG